MGNAGRGCFKEESAEARMTLVLPFKAHATRAKTVPRVLYIGPAGDEICNIITHHIGRVEIAYETEVQAAFAQLRRQVFDVVLVDQRDENLATRLILPVLQSVGYPIKPVVISDLNEVGHYLAIPGVARVLAAPVKEAQLLRVLGLERRQERDAEVALKPPAVKSKEPVKSYNYLNMLLSWFMNLVSTLYKRAAFVLLFSLFVAFAFYGVLIGFFLLSSGWGAPLTLTRGHAMVSKVERDITEVQVALNQTEQRLSDMYLSKATAERQLEEATSLLSYAAGTVKKELQSRARQGKGLRQGIKRLKKVRSQLAAQVDGNGASADLEKLYKRRLIDRSAYSAGTLSLIDAGQKLAAIDIEIEQAETQIAEFSTSKEMLDQLYDALKKGEGLGFISASASDLLLLTKQSSDALAAKSIAETQLKSLLENKKVLEESRKVLQNQLSELLRSPLARALEKRIDVVFVPYGNEGRFRQGQPLYSCGFTILWCSKVGTVGPALPGEINSVHPFFGKPLRGSFVEVTLDSPDAAMREIIHGTRKPLFF
jgi:hypothetical protein